LPSFFSSLWMVELHSSSLLYWSFLHLLPPIYSPNQFPFPVSKDRCAAATSRCCVGGNGQKKKGKTHNVGPNGLTEVTKKSEWLWSIGNWQLACKNWEEERGGGSQTSEAAAGGVGRTGIAIARKTDRLGFWSKRI
jgi:hypothetical protein